MKVLLVSQARQVPDQQSYHNAFANAECRGRQVELVNIPFLGCVEKLGWAGFYRELARANEQFKPNMIFFQFFHGGGEMRSPVECIGALRSAANHPLIFASLGDLFQESYFHLWRKKMPQALIEMAVHSDAFFSTSMGGIAEFLVKRGAKNIIFLPHAYSALFDECRVDRQYEFDAVMVGSVYLSMRKPIGSLAHYMRRLQTVRQLRRMFGERFGLYGMGWRFVPCRGPIEFAQQVGLYRKSLMVVDACAPYNEVYYSSDRPFYIAGSGSMLVQYYTPRFEKIFKDGVHVHFVRKPNQLEAVCDKIARMPAEERTANQKATAALVRSRHMIEHRVDTILSTYEAIFDFRQGGMDSSSARERIRMWHFLPNVDLKEEYGFCTANWVG